MSNTADDFRVDYDPDVWLPIPTVYPDGDDASTEDWAARQAAHARDRGFKETLDSGTLDQYFVDMVDAARRSGEHGSYWALVDGDAPGFLAVTLDVEPADGRLEDTLSALTAVMPREYEPATFEQVTARGLGEGICVYRTDRDSDDRVYQSRFWVFRAADTDYVVSAETYNTASLAWAMPKIADLIDGIAPMQVA